MDALTFVHHGGTFFPSSILLEDNEAPPSTNPVPEQRRHPEIIRENPATEFKRSVRIRSRHVSTVPQTLQPDDEDEVYTPAFTPRQSEVLERLGEGKPNKVIARDLNMTEATVKVHVRQIMRKFGVANRTQAALCAVRFATAYHK